MIEEKLKAKEIKTYNTYTEKYDFPTGTIGIDEALSICQQEIDEQRKLDIALCHKIADDCYNRKIINHKEIDDLFNTESLKEKL